MDSTPYPCTIKGCDRAALKPPTSESTTGLYMNERSKPPPLAAQMMAARCKGARDESPKSIDVACVHELVRAVPAAAKLLDRGL